MTRRRFRENEFFPRTPVEPEELTRFTPLLGAISNMSPSMQRYLIEQVAHTAAAQALTDIEVEAPREGDRARSAAEAVAFGVDTGTAPDDAVGTEAESPWMLQTSRASHVTRAGAWRNRRCGYTAARR
jgi:hypothetical protein